MDVLGLDYETYSEVDLREVGAHAYAMHPSTEVLMAAWSLNGVVQDQWVPAEFEPIPRMLEEALQDREVVKWAWNAQFERLITKHALCLPTSVQSWRCTMVLACYNGLPGKLEKAGEALELDAEHLKNTSAGSALIRRFSVPHTPTQKRATPRIYPWQEPDRWQEFLDYNAQDEVAERTIKSLLIHNDLPRREWKMYVLDQMINDKGMPVSPEMIENCHAIYVEEAKRLLEEMNDITDLPNSNNVERLRLWLEEHGYPYESLRKGDVGRALKREDAVGVYRKVLQLRQMVSQAAPKKYSAMLDRIVTNDDGEPVLCGAFQLFGAQRTGRWAGRGIQPQNFKRPTKAFMAAPDEIVESLTVLRHHEAVAEFGSQLMDHLGSATRTVIQAPEGRILADADLSAIENRVLGWMCECKPILDVYRKNRDPYIDFATRLYEEPYDKLFAEYKAGDGVKRTVAKPGTLGCGYQLGAGRVYLNEKTGEEEATGLLGYAWNMGITDFTIEQSELSVKTFRGEFREVPKFWYGIEDAARDCIMDHRKVNFWPIRFEWSFEDECMYMRLPSNRTLVYRGARTEYERKWSNSKQMHDAIYYMNPYQGAMVTAKTYGGKLTENADQAMARDILAFGLINAYKEGLDIRMHVHDQIVIVSDEDRAEDELALLRDCMTVVPKWAKGLPLGAGGFLSPFFLKD